MGNSQDTKQGPDLSQGIPLDQLADGKMLVGQIGGEDVLLVRRVQDIFPVGRTAPILLEASAGCCSA
jgi:hypothetical protein